MKTSLEFENKTYQSDLSNPLDISMPLSTGKDTPSAWYVAPPKIEPVRTEQFIGSVKEGGSVNFRNISFNPHGNGTHTECVGHISREVHSINQVLNQFFFFAELISIEPKKLENGDQVILWEQIESIIKTDNTDAIIIRTLPNTDGKLTRQYSETNPPYVDAEVMSQLIKRGIKHFLIDLPSVDRELDNGVLAAHHVFWEHPKKTNLERTITELIYVPSAIQDGLYLLNLQIAPFENDASPSKPVLYSLTES
ncbi:MAG: cyclase family protein [Flavobacteriales bacterium]|nr:cyclase family protein [Flavobacteriales bacterium]